MENSTMEYYINHIDKNIYIPEGWVVAEALWHGPLPALL